MKKTYLWLGLILALAAFLRFYELGNNPPALDWDEASLGYNAYSLLKTGKDEFGRPWPVSIRSFEDYKPAVYTYLTIPSVAVLGLTEFAVRLPSAVFGWLTIIASYLLVKEMWQNEKLALLVSFLLAISPWHLQFSRVAFEANMAMLFVIAGIWSFCKGLKSGAWFIVAAIFFVLSFYTYHSPRLVVPLLLLGWAVYFRKQMWEKRRWVAAGSIIGFLLLTPFFIEITSVGRARLGSVTVVKPEEQLAESIHHIEYDQSRGDLIGKLLHNRRIVYTLAIVKGYLDHFNLDFLFLTGDAPDRHHARDMGMLYLWEGPFILIGILSLLNKQNLPLLWWFLVAPAASALTTGTPHAVRALTYLPIYQIFTSVGLIRLLGRIRRLILNKKLSLAVTVVGLMLITINVYYYLESYYIHTPVEAAKVWQFGYKQVVAEINKYENEVEKVIVTYAYDQPHVYVLFYKQINPGWYQSQVVGKEVKRFERSFGKYEFRNINWAKEQFLTNALLIGTPNEIPESTVGIVENIHFPDGTIAFRVVKR